MVRRQLLDLIDEFSEISENFSTVLNGVDFDDRGIIKPAVKISNDLNGFIARLQQMSMED